MRITSLTKIERQVALPIHVYATRIVVDPKMRAAVVMVLARLLLESAAASVQVEEVGDEP